ncbi:hypothetical protein ACGFRG_07975 [Streptomyces sp. NPDC048696]|uniref:hypothetical protein n=1 Tax=Streptomyces sp. NPDC048696 TaxID=3365585 RepID=UPI00371B5117
MVAEPFGGVRWEMTLNSRELRTVHLGGPYLRLGVEISSGAVVRDRWCANWFARREVIENGLDPQQLSFDDLNVDDYFEERQ